MAAIPEPLEAIRALDTQGAMAQPALTTGRRECAYVQRRMFRVLLEQGEALVRLLSDTRWQDIKRLKSRVLEAPHARSEPNNNLCTSNMFAT